MNYSLGDPLPPVGTRVAHETFGPGEIVGDHILSEQWLVKFDNPAVPIGGPAAWVLWVYPYTLSPAGSEPASPPPFNLAAIIEGMGDLDPRLVRAEIAMRLIRVAAGNLAGTPYSGAFRVLEEAKSVLGPATNGINGAGVGYAVEYVERFLDTLAETGPPR